MRQALIQEAEARCFPYSVEMPTDQAYRFTPLPGDGRRRGLHDFAALVPEDERQRRPLVRVELKEGPLSARRDEAGRPTDVPRSPRSTQAAAGGIDRRPGGAPCPTGGQRENAECVCRSTRWPSELLRRHWLASTRRRRSTERHGSACSSSSSVTAAGSGAIDRPVATGDRYRQAAGKALPDGRGDHVFLTAGCQPGHPRGKVVQGGRNP